MPTNRVFFSNVPFTTTEETLLGLFAQFGNVERLIAFQKPQGGFKGMGVCIFEHVGAAQTAIQHLLDADVDGRPIWVAEDTSEDCGKGRGTVSQPLEMQVQRILSMQPSHSMQPVRMEGLGPMHEPFRKPPVKVECGMSRSSSCVPGVRVFFSNVPFTTSEETLRRVFESVGALEKLILFQGHRGFRGMGVAIFVSTEDAAKSIVTLRDVDVDGRPLWVAPDTGREEDMMSKASQQALPAFGPGVWQNSLVRPEPSPRSNMSRGCMGCGSMGCGGLGCGSMGCGSVGRGMGFPASPHRTPSHNPGLQAAQQEPVEVFFSNIPFTTTKETLLSVFSTAGPVASMRLFNKRNGESRGMGVCTYDSPECARCAVQHLRDAPVDGRPMWVAIHTHHSPSQQLAMVSSPTVFFSNVPYEVEEHTLVQFFEEVGRVIELHLFTKKGGGSKGMGHCTFEDAKMAAAAVQGLRDRNVGGRPIWVAENTGAGEGLGFPGVVGFGPIKNSVGRPPMHRYSPYDLR